MEERKMAGVLHTKEVSEAIAMEEAELGEHKFDEAVREVIREYELVKIQDRVSIGIQVDGGDGKSVINYPMSRYAAGLPYTVVLTGEYRTPTVDHIDPNQKGRDSRCESMRLVTKNQNCFNACQSKIAADESKYHGTTGLGVTKKEIEVFQRILGAPDEWMERMWAWVTGWAQVVDRVMEVGGCEVDDGEELDAIDVNTSCKGARLVATTPPGTICAIDTFASAVRKVIKSSMEAEFDTLCFPSWESGQKMMNMTIPSVEAAKFERLIAATTRDAIVRKRGASRQLTFKNALTTAAIVDIMRELSRGEFAHMNMLKKQAPTRTCARFDATRMPEDVLNEWERRRSHVDRVPTYVALGWCTAEEEARHEDKVPFYYTKRSEGGRKELRMRLDAREEAEADEETRLKGLKRHVTYTSSRLMSRVVIFDTEQEVYTMEGGSDDDESEPGKSNNTTDTGRAAKTRCIARV